MVKKENIRNDKSHSVIEQNIYLLQEILKNDKKYIKRFSITG